jgi:vanillate O-demethylase ferredoxin subunit
MSSFDYLTTQVRAMYVYEIIDLKPQIRQFRLRAKDGLTLPSFTAGAHIRIQVMLANGALDWRHYSLIHLLPEALASQPIEYVIAVRLETNGRGGSSFMHNHLKTGDELTIALPQNDFPIGDHASRALLVAGGIGITPLLTMASQRQASGLAVQMIYAGRSRGGMAYLPELQSLLGKQLYVHADDEADGPLDFNKLLQSFERTTHLYVCGPGAMLAELLSSAEYLGWSKKYIHFELFSPAAPISGDVAFEVFLNKSQRTLKVAADQTILNCLSEAGLDPVADCLRGECGVCAVEVIEGEIEHRDHVLTKAEKDAGKIIQICVSRAKSSRLILDL